MYKKVVIQKSLRQIPPDSLCIYSFTINDINKTRPKVYRSRRNHDSRLNGESQKGTEEWEERKSDKLF